MLELLLGLDTADLVTRRGQELNSQKKSQSNFSLFLLLKELDLPGLFSVISHLCLLVKDDFFF